jgi:hypothetical protein
VLLSHGFAELHREGCFLFNRDTSGGDCQLIGDESGFLLGMAQPNKVNEKSAQRGLFRIWLNNLIRQGEFIENR